MLALVLLAVIVFWIFYSNRLTLTAIHPQLASSRGAFLWTFSDAVHRCHRRCGDAVHFQRWSADSQFPAGAARRFRAERRPESETVPRFFRAVRISCRGRRADGFLLFRLLRRRGHQSGACRNFRGHLLFKKGQSVMDTVNIRIIARMHSDFATKFGIPRQSGLVEALRSTIVFEPEFRNSDALRGIEDFSHLWAHLAVFRSCPAGLVAHRAPPRLGGSGWASSPTRSPFRPNNLRLSSVRLLGVEQTREFGTVLHVGGADLMDGTPIF